MARLAGLSLKERWGNWRREPFTGMSERHVSVWQKPDRRPAYREGGLAVVGVVNPDRLSLRKANERERRRYARIRRMAGQFDVILR